MNFPGVVREDATGADRLDQLNDGCAGGTVGRYHGDDQDRHGDDLYGKNDFAAFKSLLCEGDTASSGAALVGFFRGGHVYQSLRWTD